MYGTNHKDIAVCYSKIATIYYYLGDYKNSIYYQKQSINILKKIFGFDHYLIAQGYQNIGFYYFSMKKYNLAIKYIKKSLFLFFLIGGDASPDT